MSNQNNKATSNIVYFRNYLETSIDNGDCCFSVVETEAQLATIPNPEVNHIAIIWRTTPLPWERILMIPKIAIWLGGSWLVKSLVGASGANGFNGANGTNGTDGEDGATGAQGIQGETGLPPEHAWDGTKLKFRAPNGTWGVLVDLKGNTGATGATGATGGMGSAPTHQWSGTSIRFTNPDGSWGAYVDVQGLAGNDGEDGATGEQGETGAIPIHELNPETYEIRFELPDGSWGEWMYIRGETGAQGEQGEQGEAGADGNDGLDGAVMSVNGQIGDVDLNTDDIDEGEENLYYKAERAQEDAVIGAITSGVHNQAPSSDAVHDALALKADKTYVDSALTGLWQDVGAYIVNASGNINYPSSGGSGTAGALMKGDLFTVAGAVVNVSTVNGNAVNNGDTIRALIDNPSATNDAHWAIGENNIGYVPENVANKATTMSGNTTSDSKYLSAKAIYDWGVGKFQDILTDVNLGSFVNGLTSKTTPIGADQIMIMDSADGNKKKKLSWTNLRAIIFGGDILLPAYTTARDDGALPTNKILSVDGSGNLKLYSMPIMPPPYLEELIPDSYSPSSTGNIIVKGSFFTPTTTVTIEGQTLNYLTFISDNEILVNVTTNISEGTYDVTINNGIEVVFTNALLLIEGEVFKPVSGDWTDTSLVDINGGDEVKIETFGSLGNAKWIQAFDYTVDWKLKFNVEASPLGTYPTGQYQVQDLCLKTSGGTTIFKYQTYKHASGNLYHHCWTVANDWAYSGGSYSNDLSDSSIYPFELRYVSGILYAYQNGVLGRTFTDVLTENLFLVVTPRHYDFNDIKYIETV